MTIDEDKRSVGTQPICTPHKKYTSSVPISSQSRSASPRYFMYTTKDMHGEPINSLNGTHDNLGAQVSSCIYFIYFMGFIPILSKNFGIRCTDIQRKCLLCNSIVSSY